MPIRLNRNRRDILHAFADNAVSCPEERQTADDAYDRAADLVKSAVESKFPPKDMKLLKKYDVAALSCHIDGGTPHGSYAGFVFRDDDERAPLLPKRFYGTRSVLFDQETTDAILEAAKLKERHSKALSEKRRNYGLLINSAKTFEEVVDIWPAAETMREAVEATLTALSTISEEMASKIRADNAGAETAEAKAA